MFESFSPTHKTHRNFSHLIPTNEEKKCVFLKVNLLLKQLKEEIFLIFSTSVQCWVQEPFEHLKSQHLCTLFGWLLCVCYRGDGWFISFKTLLSCSRPVSNSLNVIFTLKRGIKFNYLSKIQLQGKIFCSLCVLSNSI